MSLDCVEVIRAVSQFQRVNTALELSTLLPICRDWPFSFVFSCIHPPPLETVPSLRAVVLRNTVTLPVVRSANLLNLVRTRTWGFASGFGEVVEPNLNGGEGGGVQVQCRGEGEPNPRVAWMGATEARAEDVMRPVPEARGKRQEEGIVERQSERTGGTKDERGRVCMHPVSTAPALWACQRASVKVFRRWPSKPSNAGTVQAIPYGAEPRTTGSLDCEQESCTPGT
ncbi:hypothetical protein BJV74DRAFT_798293 [Russula compacta]|nr:hypothetical protein BJV74DRAFT_798293 [Russula compacta]